MGRADGARRPSSAAGTRRRPAEHRVTHEDGTCRLFRTGDAVAQRNVHAVLLDARRLCGSP
ncbi:hypothetical protein C3492_10890 [Streptomyces sp. Ru62]|nr:hypothetical protein C3492_10890 [Streptomyces sp. Ru62]